jgi:hypothetical protein
LISQIPTTLLQRLKQNLFEEREGKDDDEIRFGTSGAVWDGENNEGMEIDNANAEGDEDLFKPIPSKQASPACVMSICFSVFSTSLASPYQILSFSSSRSAIFSSSC